MLSILFPRSCHICGTTLEGHLRFLCSSCAGRLPFTGDLLRPMNDMDQRFLHIRPAERCAAWLAYAPGTPVATLLEQIKYEGRSRLARYLGRLMGEQAVKAGMTAGVDYLVPVPLHPLRRFRRGYNQSLMIAAGVSAASGVPVADMLRCRYHRTQTALSPRERRENVEGVFSMRRRFRHMPGNMTLMLIDDVCTTGATLSSMAEQIIKYYPEARIRIFTLAAVQI